MNFRNFNFFIILLFSSATLAVNLELADVNYHIYSLKCAINKLKDDLKVKDLNLL